MTRRAICDNCGLVMEIDDDWTEEEKVAEMKANIGDIPPEDRATVCDDCYEAIMRSHPPYPNDL